MTTEDDFQAMLDACPDDHVTRLILADWLQERGDPRAEGYRALGVRRLFPCLQEWPEDVKVPVSFCFASPRGCLVKNSRTDDIRKHILPQDWFNQIDGHGLYWTADYASRREAEDAAALAFATLPAARRAELLATKTTEG